MGHGHVADLRQEQDGLQIENTLNRSIGPTSKTEFDAGGFSYDQLVQPDRRAPVPDGGLSSPLNVAVGAEARREGYELFAGEPDSYRFGGQLLPSGLPAAPGAQVFPGFRPANASTPPHRVRRLRRRRSQHHQAVPGLVRGARRALFGLRQQPGRASWAPATTSRRASRCAARCRTASARRRCSSRISQSTSTNFINGVPFEITTFKPTDPAAIALGAKPLDAEKSVNLSLGAVFRADPLSVTVDAYRIKIKTASCCRRT
jgi:iron complex outermembrane receptor protein